MISAGRFRICGRRMCPRMTQRGLRAWIRMSSHSIFCLTVLILQPCRPGTSHLVTIDHSGLAISAITTINLLFGSKLVVPETGIIMNNEMDGSYMTSKTLHHSPSPNMLQTSQSPTPPTPSATSPLKQTSSARTNAPSPPAPQQ